MRPLLHLQLVALARSKNPAAHAADWDLASQRNVNFEAKRISAMCAAVAKRLLLAAAVLAACLTTPGCSRILSKPAPPRAPEPEELTRGATSIWSVTYSPDGALLLIAR